MDDIATEHMKTYQIWHHRRLLIEKLKTPIPELAFIEGVLDIDGKNYHTWSYRQWLLAYFNDPAMWAGEIPYIERMLEEDVRNNSAWHHRFFVVWDSGIRGGDENREDTLRRELWCVMHVPFFFPSQRERAGLLKRKLPWHPTTILHGIIYAAFSSVPGNLFPQSASLLCRIPYHLRRRLINLSLTSKILPPLPVPSCPVPPRWNSWRKSMKRTRQRRALNTPPS